MSTPMNNIAMPSSGTMPSIGGGGGLGGETLMLDPDIRDWVVLPLFVIMVTAGLLRHAVGQLLQGDKQKIPYIASRAQNCIKYTSKIRSGAAHYMSTWKWHVRKEYYIKRLQEEADWCEEEDVKQKEANEANGGGNASDDPLAAMGNPMEMMKGSMAFMIQNMVMMQGIQYFFSGFILLKVPFPLTAGFKSMFQRGLVEMPDLDPAYVSSVSWYFLVMYGLRQFFRLAIGEPSTEMREQNMRLFQQGWQNPVNPAQSKNQDAEGLAKMLRQESETLELFMTQHKSDFDNVEKRLLGKRYPRRNKNTGAGSGQDTADFFLGNTPSSTSNRSGGKGSSKSKKKKEQ